ncbi:hypothetical protein [Agathobaculum sp. Marseille-P7918]
MKKKNSYLQNLGAVAYAMNRSTSVGPITSADRDFMKALHDIFK